jgi:hypothetical protein
VVVGPDVAVGRWDCGDCDLPFRVSVGTERSADMAPMRRAI